MFDSYVRQGDRHVHVTQQPNDAADAARLHGEIRKRAEDEARQAIIHRAGARNEIVFAAVHQDVRLDTGERKVRVLFSINGVPYDVMAAANDFGGPRQRVAEALANAVAAKVIAEVMRPTASAGEERG